jgi:HK97 family phage major capsid protein
MSDEIKSLVESGLKSIGEKVEASITKFEGQLAEKGKVDAENVAEVKALTESYKELSATVTALAQKGVQAQPEERPKSAGEEFVKSDKFKLFASGAGDVSKIRVELKNTVLGSPTTTTNPSYQPGVVPGAFRPLSIRGILPQYQTGTDLVVLTREASFTNNAAGQTQGALKAESAITFNKYNVPVETIAHTLKVSKQLTSDAPAVVTYIEDRLRFKLEDKVDDMLLNGDGTSPNLSGLRDTGNFTVYTPTAGDNLINAINRAKYQLWAVGYIPDAVIVNPADWGTQEIEQATDGQYLYGLPGLISGMNPFGVKVVISTQMPAGQFLIGKFAEATGVWNREGTILEMAYSDDDFVKNLITIRVETRLGLEVSVPAAILGGAFTA